MIGIFVRHGYTTKNERNMLSNDVDTFPLTPKGRAEAEGLGLQLQSLVRVDRLYTSPVLRARETAEIISKNVKMAPEVEPLLSERGFGKYNNTEFPSNEALLDFVREQIQKNYPDIESWKEMQNRMVKFTERMGGIGIIMAVTHHDPINPLLGHMLNKEETEMLSVKIPPCSFTVIDFDKPGADSVLTVGSQALPKSLLKVI